MRAHSTQRQLALGLEVTKPSEEQLRAAHRILGLRLSFDEAMADRCFSILVRNFAEARLARTGRIG